MKHEHLRHVLVECIFTLNTRAHNQEILADNWLSNDLFIIIVII